jgi:hypothetical protein
MKIQELRKIIREEIEKVNNNSVLKKGLTVHSTKYNNLEGTFSIFTKEEGEIKIGCAGGADVSIGEEFEINNPLKIKSLKVEPHIISIGFGEGKNIEIEDETGGETLEIYKNK